MKSAPTVKKSSKTWHKNVARLAKRLEKMKTISNGLARQEWALPRRLCIVGSFGPSALYSMIGLNAAGPVAGGWFAGM